MNPDLNSLTSAINRLVEVLHKSTWDYINPIAVVLTLLVLIWYTVETYKLRLAAQKQTESAGSLLQEAQRQSEVSTNLVKEAQGQNEVTTKLLKEAQRQNELAVMPMAAVFIQSAPNGNRAIVIENVGSGPAFNLSIDRIQFGNGELLVECGGTVMRVGETRELGFQFQEQNSTTILHLDSLYEWINNGRLPDPVDVILRCGSINRTNYAFTFRFTPDPTGTGRLKITFEGVTP